jgi:hypothetical protein
MASVNPVWDVCELEFLLGVCKAWRWGNGVMGDLQTIRSPVVIVSRKPR